MKITKTTDEMLRSLIEEKLKENDGYSPCRRERTAETKCMCKEFRDQIANKENGVCHCGLYVANFDE
jgi:ferredoxin-thioredoxin reductase catalytic subunit